MPISPLRRRAFLQSGTAVAGALVLAGFEPQPGHAAPPSGIELVDPPLSGTLAGHVVVEPDRTATIHLVQLDTAAQPIRPVASDALSLTASGASLQQIGRHAHEMALEVVSRSWGVPKAECIADAGRITHAAGRRSIGYALWIDIA